VTGTPDLLCRKSPLLLMRRNMWSIILPLLVGIPILCAVLMPYPWHASCTIQWRVPAACESVSQALVTQLRAWEGESLCPSTSPACPALPCGQRCLYTLLHTTGGVITAAHQTPVARYTDSLRFSLSDTDQDLCSVEATSKSDTWYAVLDFGTNYCNLRNLVEGAGLAAVPGFTETTQDSVCTQYSSRDCGRF